MGAESSTGRPGRGLGTARPGLGRETGLVVHGPLAAEAEGRNCAWCRIWHRSM